MRRESIYHLIAPPAIPPGPLTQPETDGVLSQQRFDLAAEIRIDAGEQIRPLGAVALLRGMKQFLNLMPALRPGGHGEVRIDRTRCERNSAGSNAESLARSFSQHLPSAVSLHDPAPARAFTARLRDQSGEILSDPRGFGIESPVAAACPTAELLASSRPVFTNS